MSLVVTEEQKQRLLKYGISIERENKTNFDLLLNGSNSVRLSKGLFEKLAYSVDHQVKSESKLPKFTFGVELEFVGFSSQNKIVEFDEEMRKRFGVNYYNASHYYHNDGFGWVLGADSSIQFTMSSKPAVKGYELSSPVMTMCKKDLDDLKFVIDLVKSHLGGYVNSSCGTHVHIGFSGDKLYRNQIETLLAVYSNMESVVFDPIVPLSRRRNKYCKKTTAFISNKYQKLSARYCRFTYSRECKSLHLECRQLEGTLDFNAITHWVNLQSSIIYDILSNIDDIEYISVLKDSTIFDILFRYNFDPCLISFFIQRVALFKSKTIQSHALPVV